MPNNNSNNEDYKETPLTERVADYLQKKLPWNNLTSEEKQDVEKRKIGYNAEPVPLTKQVASYLTKKLKWTNLTPQEQSDAKKVIDLMTFKVGHETKPFQLKLPPGVPISGGRRTRKSKRHQKKRRHTRKH